MPVTCGDRIACKHNLFHSAS